MMALTHTLVGVGGYVALGSFFPESINVSAMGIGAVAGGSLLPDIDDPHSWLGRRLWPLAYIVSTLTRHRGFTHSLLGAALIVGTTCLMFPLNIFSSFLFGYISHLLADYFSNSGVPLFWPKEKRFAFPFAIQTGGLIEGLITLTLGCGLFYTLLIQLKNSL